MKKISLIVLLFAFCGMKAYSQYDCYYVDDPNSTKIVETTACGNYENYIPNNETAILEVKINFHFFRKDDGTGLYQPADSN